MPYTIKAVRTILNKARRSLSTDPETSLRLVESLLDRAESHPELVAETTGMLGLARQFTGDKEGALTAFRQALSLEKRALEKGHLFCQWAMLEIERRRYDEALAKVLRGYTLVVQSDPTDKDMAQVLLARAMCYRYHERYRESEADNHRALRYHIHPRRHARLHYAAVQNLAVCYLYGTGGLERVEQALDAILEAEAILRRYRIPQRSMQGANLAWTKGLVLRIVGATERTESLLQFSQRTFKEIGAFTEWLRVSLDLAELYLSYGELGRLRRLVSCMLAVADDREILAPLRLFHECLVDERLTEAVLARVYRAIHGQQRRVPLLAASVDEFDAPIGF